MIDPKNYDLLVTLNVAAANLWAVPTSAASGAPLLGLAQGTSATTRIGRTITVKSIEFNLELALNAAATPQDEFSYCLVRDNQANKAIPAVLDVFASTDLQGFPNMDNLDRFDFLVCGKIDFTPGYATQNIIHTETISWQNPGDPVTYTGSSGVITEMTETAYYLFSGSCLGSVTANGRCRTLYSDN